MCDFPSLGVLAKVELKLHHAPVRLMNLLSSGLAEAEFPYGASEFPVTNDKHASQTPVGATLSTTALLLDRVRLGDQEALSEIIRTLQPLLLRWAHGRVPPTLRGLYETQDLIQESFTRAISAIDRFEFRGPGAFLAYLRQVFLNFLTDQFRRKEHRSESLTNAEQEVWHQTSRFRVDPDMVSMVQYEQALGHLSEEEREAVILRIEFGLSFEELATELNKPSANAARMYVSRAVAKLGERIG